MPSLLLLALVVAAAILTWGISSRYRQDLTAARDRVASVDRRIAPSDIGPVEYTDTGRGPCLLVSHGIFHGCDGGQRAARDVVSERRIVSPSRFGYLGSAMPAHASGATQADAFVTLLDHLGIDTADVMGVSAGTSAAVQFALRHPERVDHLVISSGNWPGSPTSEAPPRWATSFYNDPAMWTLKTVAPPMVAGLMGVPKGFPEDGEQAAYIDEMVDSIFPLAPRRAGAVFDAFTSNPEINDYPLERLSVPTLIIHAKDDPLASHDAARQAAERIPGATLVSLDSGGHLGLGRTASVHDAIEAFLADS